jgi:nucleoside-diphosphate-sugar epimerase
VVTAPTWVVGAGGLLGKAVVRQLAERDLPVLTRLVPWPDPAAAHEALSQGVDRLREVAAGGPWRVAWCAGAGVTGSSQDDLDHEVATFRGFLAALGAGPPAPAGSALFLTSSAGALYAGAADAGALPPFTEAHQARSISAYGDAKLAAERAAAEFADRTGVSVLTGRISNLYGPGQNLAKPQGLVSHICRAQLSGQPISVYVSLDTVRDYLFVDDAAGLICDALDRLAVAPAGTSVIKILASQRGVTIGALLAECRRLAKRAPRVVLGSSPFARLQVRDLRMRSVVWPELDRRTLTTLAAGISATNADLLRGLQLGERRAG